MKLLNKNKGYLMVIGAGICWGTTGIFSTIIFRTGVDPILTATLRLYLSTIFFLPFIFFSNYYRLLISKKDLLLFSIYGLVGIAFCNYFYLQTINLVGVAIAVVLLYTAPAFVIVISYFFLRESITAVKVIALMMTLAGIFLVVMAYDRSKLQLNIIGIIMGLGAGLTFGLMSIFSKFALKKYDHITSVFYLFLCGSFFISFLCPPWELFKTKWPGHSMLALTGLVIISTILAYLLYVYGLGYLEAGRASITVAIEPVTAIILASLFLGETLLLPQYCGIALVISGILLLNLKG